MLDESYLILTTTRRTRELRDARNLQGFCDKISYILKRVDHLPGSRRTLFLTDMGLAPPQKGYAKTTIEKIFILIICSNAVSLILESVVLSIVHKR